MGTRRLDEYLRQVGRGVRNGSIDVEAFVRRLVEEAMLAVCRDAPSRGTTAGSLEVIEGKLAEIVRRLGELEERLARLENMVEAMAYRKQSVISEKDVELIASAIASALSKLGIGQTTIHAKPRSEPKWLQFILDRVSERGYVLLSELPEKVRSEVSVKVLAEKGFIVERLGGDVVIASSEGVEKFLQMLSRIRTSDEYEAELKLAEYGRLFRLLRSEGLVYYSHDKGWVVKAFKPHRG